MNSELNSDLRRAILSCLLAVLVMATLTVFLELEYSKLEHKLCKYEIEYCTKTEILNKIKLEK